MFRWRWERQRANFWSRSASMTKLTETTLAGFFPSPLADPTGEARRIILSGLMVIATVVTTFAIWSILAPLAGAVVAGGVIKIETKRKTVQHPEGGIISEILVKEGDAVEANQPLIYLEDTDASAQLHILQDQRLALTAKEARLMAEKRLAPEVNFPDTLTHSDNPKAMEILRYEKSLFQTRLKALNDKIALLSEEVGHTRKEETDIKSQSQSLQEGTSYMRERLDSFNALYEKRFVEKHRLLELKEKLADAKERHAALSASLSTLHEKQSEIELRIIEAKNQFMQEADEALKDTQKELFENEEKLRPIHGIHQRKTITAPIAGQVIDLRVSTKGGFIKPGDAVLDIVPVQRELIFEARVNTADIDSVHVGQATEIQLSAYNQRTTPLLNGSVIYVSGDALEDPNDRHNLYYLVHIRSAGTEAASLPDIQLTPGMPVTAFIKTEERTLFSYLASPIISSTRKSFREPD